METHRNAPTGQHRRKNNRTLVIIAEYEEDIKTPTDNARPTLKGACKDPATTTDTKATDSVALRTPSIKTESRTPTTHAATSPLRTSASPIARPAQELAGAHQDADGGRRDSTAASRPVEVSWPAQSLNQESDQDRDIEKINDEEGTTVGDAPWEDHER